MQTWQIEASDGGVVGGYFWPVETPRGAIQIAHGMGEHAGRYDRVAQALNAAGYTVVANDHRGHGITGQAKLGYFGIDGWNRVLADAYEINRWLAQTCPDVPLVLIGHSMGSMLAQQYVTRYGHSIDLLVLSGSPGFKAKSINPLPGWILAFETWRVGPENGSETMQKLLFGSANNAFAGPEATGFEWLSADPSEVQKYVDDDRCGFVIATGSLKDLYGGAGAASHPDSVAKIPKTLPIYVFAGTADPVNSEQQDIERMVAAYREGGLTAIDVRWYQDGRHEMLNETNRDEVTADLLAWLAKQIP
ncbi:MAG: alpha/beta hydrolase [Pseudomonadota bacterium]